MIDINVDLIYISLEFNLITIYTHYSNVTIKFRGVLK